MPTYEYRCRKCRKRSSVFLLSYKEAVAHTCPHCASTELTRIMSRFATVKSDEARMESLADPSSIGDLDENDPASVARWMKRMGKEMGEDLGDDFEGAVDKAVAGEKEGDAGEGSEEPNSF